MAFEVSLPARGTTLRATPGTAAPEGAALLIPVASGEDGIEVPVTALAPKGLLEALVAVGAKGTAGEVTRLLIDGILVITFGLGDASEIDDEAVRRGAGSAARALNDVERAAISTGSPASRRSTQLTPLTTRPASTSRQGMTRTARLTSAPSSRGAQAGRRGPSEADRVDRGDQDAAGAQGVQLVHDAVGVRLADHGTHGDHRLVPQRGDRR